MLKDAKFYENLYPGYTQDLEDKVAQLSEMTISERRFLHSVVSHHKPRTVLEVGVSSGASSVIILDALEKSGNGRLFSVDLLQDYYRDSWNKNIPRDKVRKTGFLAPETMPHLSGRQTLFTTRGGVADCLEKTGQGFDLCLLDSRHCVPGEILDFLCILPFLNEGATVILHDISLHCGKKQTRKSADYYHIAPLLLINSVRAEKKIFPAPDPGRLTNICAFSTGEATRRDIIDVFHSLFIDWDYEVESETIQCSRALISKYYSAELNALFDRALKHYQEILQIKKQK